MTLFSKITEANTQHSTGVSVSRYNILHLICHPHRDFFFFENVLKKINRKLIKTPAHVCLQFFNKVTLLKCLSLAK